MDVNAILNVNRSANQNIIFPKGTSSSSDEMEMPREIKTPKIEEKAMMDLKDVQNFLYMLVGMNLFVQSDDKFAGDSVNVKA